MFVLERPLTALLPHLCAGHRHASVLYLLLVTTTDGSKAPHLYPPPQCCIALHCIGSCQHQKGKAIGYRHPADEATHSCTRRVWRARCMAPASNNRQLPGPAKSSRAVLCSDDFFLGSTTVRRHACPCACLVRSHLFDDPLPLV